MRTFTMRNRMLQILALLPLVAAAGWAQAPRNGMIIGDDDVQKVLQRAVETKRTIPDNMMRVIDMGGYQLGVAVIARGKLAPYNPSAAPAAAAAGNPAPPCGESRPGATGPNGLTHSETDETYIATSGSGTLILGGTLVNGRLSAADSEVTKVLNGSSCSGTMVGYASRELKPGDVVIIPIGTAHGFSSIPDHITYLSLRPDPKKVLEHGYVNPALK